MNERFLRVSLIVAAGVAATMIVHLLWARPWRFRRPRLPEPQVVRRYGFVERWTHHLLAGSLVALAVSALAPIAIHGRMGGWWLLAHMIAGAVFAVAVAVAAVLWSAEHNLDRRDWAIGRALASGPVSPAGRFDVVQKVSYWLMLLLALVSLTTVLVSMFPLAGTEGMERLLAIHRYSGLALTALVALHMYRQLIVRAGAWRGLARGTVRKNWARRHHAGWPAQPMKEGPR